MLTSRSSLKVAGDIGEERRGRDESAGEDVERRLPGILDPAEARQQVGTPGPDVDQLALELGCKLLEIGRAAVHVKPNPTSGAPATRTSMCPAAVALCAVLTRRLSPDDEPKTHQIVKSSKRVPQSR